VSLQAEHQVQTKDTNCREEDKGLWAMEPATVIELEHYEGIYQRAFIWRYDYFIFYLLLSFLGFFRVLGFLFLDRCVFYSWSED
jgi:hypothetical protein